MGIIERRRSIIASQPHLVTASGGNTVDCDYIAHFKTTVSMNVQSCIVTIPFTSGGVNSITVTRCGKNLLQCNTSDISDGTLNGITRTITKNADNEVTKIHLTGTTTSGNVFINLNYKVDQSDAFVGNFVCSTSLTPVAVIACDSVGGKRTGVNASNAASYTMDTRGLFTTSVTWYRLEFYPRSTGVSVNGDAFPMVRFPGDPDEFEPYNGSLYSVQFPATIYGGTVDLTKGIITSIYSSTGTTLSSPVAYTVTPVSIKTLAGINNIWSNIGNVSVGFWTH